MHYTVWSRGQLLGETDLGWVRVFEHSRVGWFQPTAEGMRVIAAQTAVSASTRAYVEHERACSGEPPAQVASERATLNADIEESYRHLESFEMELRREDGTVVPTEDIGFQDCRYLIESAREHVERESSGWRFEVGRMEGDEIIGEPATLDDEEELDLAESTLEEMLDGDDDRAFDPMNIPENERFQIQVRLLDANAVP